MLKNTLFVILLMISSLFTACAEGYVSDVQKEDDTKEIRFSLNMEGGLTCCPDWLCMRPYLLFGTWEAGQITILMFPCSSCIFF